MYVLRETLHPLVYDNQVGAWRGKGQVPPKIEEKLSKVNGNRNLICIAWKWSVMFCNSHSNVGTYFVYPFTINIIINKTKKYLYFLIPSVLFSYLHWYKGNYDNLYNLSNYKYKSNRKSTSTCINHIVIIFNTEWTKVCIMLIILTSFLASINPHSRPLILLWWCDEQLK